MNIDVNLTKKQTEAINYLTDDFTNEILFGGSAGGGKSYIGCAWLIINSIKYPGTRWLMGRSKLKALKQTTLNTFFEISSQWKLVEDHFIYNAQSGEINFYNGSQIILKDLFSYPSDPNFDSLGSLEITGAFIDEVNQISEKAKNIVSSRIRYKLEEYDLMPKLLMTCNPSKNWVYEQFYKKYKEATIEDWKKFIPALVTDNPNISRHYISQLEKLDNISKRRLLFGEWEYEDDGTLIKYDKIIDMFKRGDLPDFNEDFYISCDVARKGGDKAVIIIWSGLKVKEIKTFHISLTTDIIDFIKSKAKEWRISNRNIVIDGDGVGGGVVDAIINSFDFINGSKALRNENYQNLKTQCYYKLAEKINEGQIEIWNWDIDIRECLITELNMVKSYNLDKDGKLQILPKEEIKKMIGRSPDYADALMMRMVFEFKKSGGVPFIIR